MIRLVLLSVLLLLLAGVATYPYLTGGVVEQEFSHYVANTYPALQIELLEQDYQRGWLSSTAHTKVRSNYLSQIYRIEYQLQHRLPPLFPVQINSQVYQLDQGDAANVQQLPLSVTSQIRLNGDSEHQLSLSPTKLKLRDGQLSTAMWHSELVWHNAAQQVDWRSQLDHLQLQANDGSKAYLALKGVKIALQFELQNLQENGIHLYVEQFTLQQPLQNLQLRLRNAELHGRYRIVDNNINLEWHSKIGHYDADRDSYGALQLELHLQQLHLPIVKQMLLTLFNSLKAPEQQWQLVMQGWQLLQHEPLLAVKIFRMDVAAGEVVMTAQAQMRAARLHALWGSTQWWKAFDANIDLQIPQTWLDTRLTNDAQVRLQDWLAHGYVALRDQHYHSQVHWVDEQLQANGLRVGQ